MTSTETGHPADVQATIDVFRATVRAAAPTDAWRAEYHMRLSVALIDRFGRSAAQADIDEAIEHLRSAVDQTPAGHPHAAKRLSMLASAFRQRALLNRDPDGIAQAEQLHLTALAAAEPADPRLAHYRADLGLTLAANALLHATTPDAALTQFRTALRTSHPYDESALLTRQAKATARLLRRRTTP